MFIGQNVKLSHYHEGDGAQFAAKQWDDAFNNPLSTEMIHPFTAADWEKIFTRSANSHDNVEFTVRKTSDDRLIGFVGLFGISIRNHTAELALGILQSDDRGKGYGTELLHLILDYGFNNLNLHKIKLNVYPFNIGAIKAYTRVGFVKEATFKHEIFYNGQWVDTDRYAIFQADWYAKQK